MDIGSWLRRIDLQAYEQTFQDNGIDVDVLPELTEADLEKLGVLLGHRKKILRAIAASSAPVSRPHPTAAGDDASPGAGGALDGYRRREGERRQLTVMFVDLVGSTALSRRLDPEDLGQVLTAYHASVDHVSARYGGFVAKYMGDGVLVYFGYPQAHEDDAERAVRAALAVVEAAEGLEAAGERLAVRIGIATGVVVVGEIIGAGEAQERGVVGETPNLAARLQAMTDPGNVLVAESTRRLLGSIFEVESLGAQPLKGFDKPVEAFRIVAETWSGDRFAARNSAAVLPLVGRDQDLALVLGRWDLATCGEGQVVLLEGEAGIGKSRLLKALCDHVASKDHVLLRYFGSPFHTNSALHPVITEIETAAQFDRADAPAVKLAKLNDLLNGAGAMPDDATLLIADLLDIANQSAQLNMTAEQRKNRTRDALLARFGGLAAQRPVLLAIEDAHWLDPSSVELFGQLVGRIQQLPVLVVMTYRPGFAPAWRGFPHVTGLSLNRLGRDQASALIARLTGGKALPTEVLEPILAKTDGVPLFIEELTKAVLESGILGLREDRYELDGPLPPLAIPSTLQDSLMARLDRAAPIKEIAQIGAAIGREFPYEMLSAISGYDEAVLHATLDQLVASELIFSRGTHPEAVYSFKHALVQDAAYESMLRSKRRQLHGTIAKLLQERQADDGSIRPELLAYHLDRAGLPLEASRYGLQAGLLAASRSAFAESVVHLERALSICEVLPVGYEHQRLEFVLRMELGNVLSAWKGYAAPAVGRAFQSAEAICQPVASIGERLVVLWGAFSYHFVRAEYGLCLGVGRKMLQLGTQTGVADFLFPAHTIIGQSLLQLGKLVAAKRHFDKALAHADPKASSYRSSGLPDPYVALLTYQPLNLLLLGYPDQARRKMAEALERAEKESRPHQLAFVLLYAIRLNYCMQDFATLRTQVRQLEKLVGEHGFALYKAAAAVWNSWLDAKDGRTSEAIALLERGRSAYQATGALWTVPLMLVQLAEVYRIAGSPMKSLDAIDDAIQLIEQTKSHWLMSEAQRLRADVLLALGDRDAAEQGLRKSLAVARKQQAKLWEDRAAMDLARLRQSQAKA